MPLAPPVPSNSLLATNRLRQMRVGWMPLVPRWMPLPLSWKIVSRIRYPEWAGLVYMPGGLFWAPGAPRMANPSQVMSSARNWTSPGAIVPATPATTDSRPR